ncbi:MAG: aminotransferase class I/II-fold pyridoxal phosphate-dependent enzyme, partial [Candidatus Delongbacteria bacterium]
MNYDFDKKLDRRNTGCVKWDLNKQLFGRKDVLPMWVADMDIEAPPEVTDALRERVEHAAYGYTFGTDSLKEAVAGWEQNRHGWKVEKDWIMFCPGIVPAINFFIKCFTHKNDGIIVQTPVYYPFMNSVNFNRRRLVNNQLKEIEGRYKINFELLEKQASDPSVKMMLISSPHNPAGKVFSKNELLNMGNICRRNGVLLISDEIHQDVVYHPFEHICTSSLSEEISKNTITCIAPSKTFNLAGLAFSAIIIPDENIREKFSAYMST